MPCRSVFDESSLLNYPECRSTRPTKQRKDVIVNPRVILVRAYEISSHLQSVVHTRTVMFHPSKPPGTNIFSNDENHIKNRVIKDFEIVTLNKNIGTMQYSYHLVASLILLNR